MYYLYIISSIDSSCATTLGSNIMDAGFVKGAVLIDQDSYYKEAKPTTRWSNGNTMNSMETLDSSFKQRIATLLASSPVVLVGSALTANLLPVPARVHIHLVTANNPDDLLVRCCESRLQANPKLNSKRDSLFVKESIIPFYHETVQKSDISHLVNIYDSKGVRDKDLMSKITKIIESDSRETIDEIDISEPYFSLIRSENKTVEGRKISNKWQKIRSGDILKVTSPGLKSYPVKVTGVVMYLPSLGDPLTAYLQGEGLSRALPGVKTLEEGRKVYLQWSTEEEIATMGMMGIQVKVI